MTEEPEQIVLLGGPADGWTFTWDTTGIPEALVGKSGDCAYHRTEELDSEGRTIFKFVFLT